MIGQVGDIADPITARVVGVDVLIQRDTQLTPTYVKLSVRRQNDCLHGRRTRLQVVVRVEDMVEPLAGFIYGRGVVLDVIQTVVGRSVLFADWLSDRSSKGG